MSKPDAPDSLTIGSRRRGMQLVCFGDDRLEQFADWLRPLVGEFSRILAIADDHGVQVKESDPGTALSTDIEFCECLGIQFTSKMWEGSLVSGIFHLGWIEVGTVRGAAARGRKLVRLLAKRTEDLARARILSRLQHIKDFGELVSQTSGDRETLREEVSKLQASLHAAHHNLEVVTRNAKIAVDRDTSEVDRACVRMAASLIAGETCRLVAGPLVLWDDGVVYAINSWGGVPVPDGSSPAIMLDALRRSGRPLVLVSDMTTTWAWIRGPVYRRGPPHISGWRDVWIHNDSHPRGFLVDPPGSIDEVRKIHETLVAAEANKRAAKESE